MRLARRMVLSLPTSEVSRDVLEEIEELCKNVTVYEFLKQEPLPGGYHENRRFGGMVQERLIHLPRRDPLHLQGFTRDVETGRRF